MLHRIQEVFKYRSLIWALVVRHLASRYRGSILGFMWSFLNPLCLMLVYALVFKYYIRFQQVGNYTIFLFCGLLPWLWLTTSLTEATSSIVSNGHLITKSMFPAHILPTVATLTNLINFLLTLPLLFIFMWFSDVPFKSTLLLLPFLLILQFLFLQGIGLLLGSLNVYYRDIQHLIGNILTFLFFLSPILYAPDVVPEKFKFTLDFNPLAQFTIAYHDLILDGVVPALAPVLLMLATALISVFLGYYVFNKHHETFAELL